MTFEKHRKNRSDYIIKASCQWKRSWNIVVLCEIRKYLQFTFSTALKIVKEIDYTKDYKEWAIVLTYK